MSFLLHTCDLQNVTRLCSIVIKKPKVSGRAGHEGTLIFPSCSLTRKREHTAASPRLAGRCGIQMVPAGTTKENHFHLPFGMKPCGSRDSSLCWPLTGSMHCLAHHLALFLQPLELKEASSLSHWNVQNSRTRSCLLSQARRS